MAGRILDFNEPASFRSRRAVTDEIEVRLGGSAVRRACESGDVPVVLTIDSHHRLLTVAPILRARGSLAVGGGVAEAVWTAHRPHRDGALTDAVGQIFV